MYARRSTYNTFEVYQSSSELPYTRLHSLHPSDYPMA